MKAKIIAAVILAGSCLSGVSVAQEAPTASQTSVAAQTEDASPQDGAPSDAGPAALQGQAGNPAPGKAQVVFFRPKKYVGSALKFSVRENGKGLCKLYNGSYCAIDFEPGVREFTISKDATRLELEPGETYYLLNKITMGVARGRPVLLPSDAATFQATEKLEVSTKAPTDAEE